LTKLKLLYVDDEKANLTNFAIAFKKNYHVITADSGEAAMQLFVDNNDIAIVVADQRMPGMTGIELLQNIKYCNEDVVRIILTAYTEVSEIIDAINKGQIYRYIVKPWIESDLSQLLGQAREKYLLVNENKRLVQDLERDIKERKRLEGILLRRDLALSEVTDIAVKVLLNSHWQLYAEELIARLGIVMAVSRIHIFQHHHGKHDELMADSKFQWVAEHITTQFDDFLPESFSYKKQNIERWILSFNEGEPVYGNSTDFPENEAILFNNSPTKSIVNVPILTEEKCWGFMSLEDCSVERDWARPELDALKTAATLFGTAICRQEMECNIANQQAQLAHAGRLTALGEMASGIGHEIHQPLSVINLNAEICQSYLSKQDPHCLAAEAAGDITRQVNKITYLIESMRRFSRLSSERLEKILLRSPLENALHFYKEKFRLDNIEFDIQISETLPFVKSDAQKFEQIVVNFLSNAQHAVKTRKEKEIEIQKMITVILDYRNLSTKELDKLTFKKFENTSNQVIRVEVRDNGVGMDEVTQNRCMEPFYTTKPVGEGTGLGLSVSHSIVQELNFHLEIESRQGEGTIFRLYIPVEKGEQV
jgi:signal transduction histidine kinase/CheY-like chemotaxis protein